MCTKSAILELLEKNRDKSISGEHMAEALHVSRNTVWRTIKDLRRAGYAIEAATNKGYRLTGENDILSAEGIKPFLLSSDLSERILVYAETDSTNREAKAQAVSKAAHGTVILSDRQTGGKGRFGRDFFSPPGSGLYMSLILHANRLAFVNPTAITAYAGLCVCEAIESACGVKPSIKWVNDILLNGKKVGGILTEAITDFESGGIHEIIVGIGVNVSTRPEDFPEELRERASSLYPNGDQPVTRNRLAAEIINRLLLSETPKEEELFERYKKRLCMLEAEVAVAQDEETYKAKALDIDEKGRLLVRTADGEIRTLSSGEIAIL